jgi:hypothetical protein
MDILRWDTDHQDLPLHKDFVKTVVPMVLEEIVAIDTKGQCKCGVALVDSEAYCGVICKGCFLDWDGATDVGGDVATLEALDICSEAKSLVWNGKSSDNEHVWDRKRLVSCS